MKKALVFCAAEQKETQHVISVASNGEWVFTCECGRFLKFDGSLKGAELKELLSKHKKQNEGQLTQEAIDNRINELDL